MSASTPISDILNHDQLDALLDAQRRLDNATWNREFMASGGSQEEKDAARAELVAAKRVWEVVIWGEDRTAELDARVAARAAL